MVSVCDHHVPNTIDVVRRFDHAGLEIFDSDIDIDVEDNPTSRIVASESITAVATATAAEEKVSDEDHLRANRTALLERVRRHRAGKQDVHGHGGDHLNLSRDGEQLRVHAMQNRLKEIQIENERLEDDNDELEEENEHLKKEKAFLVTTMDELQERLAILRTEEAEKIEEMERESEELARDRDAWRERLARTQGTLDGARMRMLQTLREAKRESECMKERLRDARVQVATQSTIIAALEAELGETKDKLEITRNELVDVHRQRTHELYRRSKESRPRRKHKRRPNQGRRTKSESLLYEFQGPIARPRSSRSASAFGTTEESNNSTITTAKSACNYSPPHPPSHRSGFPLEDANTTPGRSTLPPRSTSGRTRTTAGSTRSPPPRPSSPTPPSIDDERRLRNAPVPPSVEVKTRSNRGNGDGGRIVRSVGGPHAVINDDDYRRRRRSKGGESTGGSTSQARTNSKAKTTKTRPLLDVHEDDDGPSERCSLLPWEKPSSSNKQKSSSSDRKHRVNKDKSSHYRCSDKQRVDKDKSHRCVLTPKW